MNLNSGEIHWGVSSLITGPLIITPFGRVNLSSLEDVYDYSRKIYNQDIIYIYFDVEHLSLQTREFKFNELNNYMYFKNNKVYVKADNKIEEISNKSINYMLQRLNKFNFLYLTNRPLRFSNFQYNDLYP